LRLSRSCGKSYSVTWLDAAVYEANLEHRQPDPLLRWRHHSTGRRVRPRSDLTVCVIINKHGSSLRPSETFLRAHITQLPVRTLPLIGNPGLRRCGDGAGPFLLSRGLVPRAWRWLVRRTGVDSIEAQDTRSLVRYLKSNSVDVVLAEYGPTGVSVADACARTGVPLVVHFHGWDAYALPRDPEIRTAYQRVFRTAAAIIGVSSGMVKQLIAIGAPEEKVVYNVYGTVLPDEHATPASAPPLYVAVGRLTPKKAPFATLLAFASVRREIPDARLEIIGDGPLRHTCEQMIRALKLDDSVVLHGVAEHARVFELLRSGRCFVQHSVVAPDGDSEGTPVAIIEAMAAGLPIVATRHAGIPDVVEEGRTGLLVDEYDVEGMTAAMLSVGRNPDYAQELGSNAREKVAESLTMQVSLARLANILSRAAGSGAARDTAAAI
jgi:colanic acid/amylovoran biosynthesis glycosyltransferase